MMLGAHETTSPVAAASVADAATAPAETSGEAAPTASTVVVKLEPVVTNISNPHNVLVRVEASILIDPTKTSEPDAVATQIQSDTLTFLRTLDLAQIEGARGLLHLREDLRERAILRSPAVSDYLAKFNRATPE